MTAGIRIRAASRCGGGFSFLPFTLLLSLLAFGAVLFVILRNYGAFEEGDRLAGAHRYAESLKDFFVPEPVKYKVYDIPILVRAQDRGSEFWNTTFPNFLRAAREETDRILAYERAINKRDDNGDHAAVNIADEPTLIAVLKEGKDLSDRTLFNIAAGDIFDFWDTAARRYDNWVLAREHHFATKTLLEMKKTELTEEERKKHTDELARLERILAKDRFLPDPKAVAGFLPHARPSAIELDEQAGTVRVTDPNAAVAISLLREAIFLERLRAKLPKDLHYLIYFGDRHGIWKLPAKYARWTVSIDNPLVVLGDKSLGAVRLMEEEGAWAIARVNESVIVQDDRSYPLPVDWRTGHPPTDNLAAFVIDRSAVTARMLAYGLFISGPEDRTAFDTAWGTVPYVVLLRRDTPVTREAEYARPVAEYLMKLLKAGPPMTMPEILTAAERFERKHKPPANAPQVTVTIPYVERTAELVVPPVTKDRFVSKEDIEKARIKQRQRAADSDPFKKWAKERPDDDQPRP